MNQIKLTNLKKMEEFVLDYDNEGSPLPIRFVSIITGLTYEEIRLIYDVIRFKS